MTTIKKPLLAGTVDSTSEIFSLHFPVYVSAKLDGIRCMVRDGKPISRSGKILPNIMVQSFFKSCTELEGLDGELIIGSPIDKNVYNKSVSGIMKEAGNPEFFFYVFDHLLSDTDPFRLRYEHVQKAVKNADCGDIVHVVHQELVYDATSLLNVERQLVGEGYEGVIIRSCDGLYKHGRSTLKEETMLKLKRFQDSEAEILNVNELMVNKNAATKDAFGHIERSTHKDNLVPWDTMGALQVRDLVSNVVFCIGTGFDDKDRDYFWQNRTAVIGKIIKYKHFPIGVKDAPRFPSYIGFRDKRDMS